MKNTKKLTPVASDMLYKWPSEPSSLTAFPQSTMATSKPDLIAADLSCDNNMRG